MALRNTTHSISPDAMRQAHGTWSTTPPAATAELIQKLQNRIRRVETARRVDPGETISTGCDAINRLLPGGGYPKGSIVQWLGPGGCGADYLSLLTAKEACRDGGALVVIDPLQQFYPPAAAAMGINMANLIVLRSAPQPQASSPTHRNQEIEECDLLWSIDQALRCPAVGAVWGPIETIDERWFRRFQLSAESSGCLGLFLQSTSQAKQPSWAEVQWLVGSPRSPTPITSNTSSLTNHAPASASTGSQRANRHRVRLLLTRCRGAQTGKSIEVGIDTVSGIVSSI